MGRLFISRKSRPVRGDLEEHAAGLTEIDGVEVEPVDDRRDSDSRLRQPMLPCTMLLIVRSPECHVMHAADADAAREKIPLFLQVDLGPRPPRSHIKDEHDGSIRPMVFSGQPEAQDLGEELRCRIGPPHGDVYGMKPSDVHLLSHRAFPPWDSARFAAVIHQLQALPLGIAKGDRSPAAVIGNSLMRDSEACQTLRPALHGGEAGDPQGGQCDSAHAPHGRSGVRPVEKCHFGAGMTGIVSIKKVIGADIVLVHGLFHHAQAQHLGVETDVDRRISGYGRQMMQTLKFH